VLLQRSGPGKDIVIDEEDTIEARSAEPALRARAGPPLTSVMNENTHGAETAARFSTAAVPSVEPSSTT